MTDNAGKLALVRKLLDQAEGELRVGNPGGAATFQAKAEELMRKYRIDEEQALAKDPTSILPTSTKVVVCNYYSEFRNEYVSMLIYAVAHCGVEYELETKSNGNGGHSVIATLVGYENDLGYAEALFTAARLVFMENLEPIVDKSLSDEMNCYRLRASGKTRREVAQLVFGNTEKVSMGRVGRYYKAECAKRGVPAALDGKGVQGAQYRESYARQFTWTFSQRLHTARQGGSGLVLHGRTERVMAHLYELFPHRRPTPKVQDNTPTMSDIRRHCVKCQKASSGACREHPYPRAARSRSVDNYYNAAAVRGREAGASAARDVAIRGDRTKALGE
jgi:hypothetical protein